MTIGSTASASGPLRVNPYNPRYFADDSGKAVYLTGSHTWRNFQDMGTSDPPQVFDYVAYINFLLRYNHNFFRLWSWDIPRWFNSENGNTYWIDPMPFQRPGPGIAADGKPKFDVTLFNQSYFDRLRSRVIYAGEHGIYVSIMLFTGASGWDSVFWSCHPFNKNNNVNGINGDPNNNGNGIEVQTLHIPAIIGIQKAYIRKVIDTVNDLDNVLYEISDESHSNSEKWQYQMIKFIKSYEARKPKQHPVGMTVEYPPDAHSGQSNAELFASAAKWISPNAEGGYKDNPPAAVGNKIIITDTDHLWGMGGDRQWVWKSFTRGLNPIFMDSDVLNDDTGFGFPNWDPNNPVWDSVRKNMGYTLQFAKRINLKKMRPRGYLASSGYCLAKPSGKEASYLVYLPLGGTVTVDLRAVYGSLNVEWFNPDTGATIYSEFIQGGVVYTFTAPFSGDAVLYVYVQP
jgi:hypothetical protein